jgi:hypothetical protein
MTTFTIVRADTVRTDRDNLSKRPMAGNREGRILSVTTKQIGLEITMKKENVGKLVDLVFKAVGLAMAVAVVVLNILKAASVEISILLLGIGLFCLAIVNLDH